MPRRGSWRTLAFVIVVAGAVATAGAAIALGVARTRSSSPPPGVSVAEGASLAGARAPQLLFRSAIPDRSFGKLAVAPLADPGRTRTIGDLTCDRVHFAAGRGLCLTWTRPFGGKPVAKIFDERLEVVRQLDLGGIPSRARVSPDGRLGATTAFVRGHSYNPGQFSTETTIVDMRSGEVLLNLEEMTVIRDRKRFWNRNFNFWGVTFARDGDHFYATLGTGRRRFLVHGSLRERLMRVLHERVECPSLSPDGTRIAFKRTLDSGGSWRLTVLDLRSMQETPLAETASVDDQVEWLDDQRVAYWRETHIWVVRADGTGRPRKLVQEASSPASVRAA